MKRTSLFLLTLLTATTGASQTRRQFETYDFETFRLHAYYTNDVMAEAFAGALRRSFPDLPGEEEAAQLAETLYR